MIHPLNVIFLSVSLIGIDKFREPPSFLHQCLRTHILTFRSLWSLDETEVIFVNNYDAHIPTAYHPKFLETKCRQHTDPNGGFDQN